MAAAQSGMMPVEFMLHVMRGEYEAIGVERDEINLAIRHKAAGDVAPYLHPKLHAIESRTKEGDNESAPFSWLPPT
jgi:hypothetical protein